MSNGYEISPQLAAPVAAILYWRREHGLDTGGKHVARICGIPETRIRATKRLYRWGKTMKLPIAKIRRDGGTQSREQIPADRMAAYADRMSDGEIFPPIVVFYDGSNYWLGDGFIRTGATEKIGQIDVEAEVRQGSQRDAQLYSFGANASHGTPRTQADVRRAILAMLSDPEWSKWSDREIAKRVGCNNATVSRHRSDLICCNATDTPRKAERNGTVYEVKTANIGKTPRTASEDDETDRPERTPSLAKVASIPKTQTTAEYTVKVGMDSNITEAKLPLYETEVAFFRQIQPELAKLGSKVSLALGQYRKTTDGIDGPFVTLALKLISAASPDKWEPCRSCRDDVLMSTGKTAFGACKKCQGFGFHLAS